jgi:hypothetical protein
MIAEQCADAHSPASKQNEPDARISERRRGSGPGDVMEDQRPHDRGADGLVLRRIARKERAAVPSAARGASNDRVRALLLGGVHAPRRLARPALKKGDETFRGPAIRCGGLETMKLCRLLVAGLVAGPSSSALAQTSSIKITGAHPLAAATRSNRDFARALRIFRVRGVRRSSRRLVDSRGSIRPAAPRHRRSASSAPLVCDVVRRRTAITASAAYATPVAGAPRYRRSRFR